MKPHITIKIRYDENSTEEMKRIRNLYAAVLHSAACAALTRVCSDYAEAKKVPKGLRYCIQKNGSELRSQETPMDVQYARLWFMEHPEYEAELKAERKLTFKQVCYNLDLPYKELKSLILQLLSNIDNNYYINNNINIINNIYNNNIYIIYNNIPCGDEWRVSYNDYTVKG